MLSLISSSRKSSLWWMLLSLPLVVMVASAPLLALRFAFRNGYEFRNISWLLLVPLALVQLILWASIVWLLVKYLQEYAEGYGGIEFAHKKPHAVLAYYTTITCSVIEALGLWCFPYLIDIHEQAVAYMQGKNLRHED